jgi:SpoVK/Ycf46/Vps4 family AAA+-type ATPase
LSLSYLQYELARIDVLIGFAVERWQQAGRDPKDAFRGLIITDEDAGDLLSLPFSSSWGIGKTGVALSPEALGAQEEAARQGQMVVEQAQRQNQMVRFAYLVQAFGLDDFERDALLICLAPALDLRYEQLYSYLQNDINRRLPSANLILDLLCAPGVNRLRMLDRLAHTAPLLRYHLLEYTSESGAPTSLLAQSLSVDKTLVGWLLGSYSPRHEVGRYMRLERPRVDDEMRAAVGPVKPLLDQARTLPEPLVLMAGPDLVAQKFAATLLAAELQRPLLKVDFAGLLAQGLNALQVVRWALRDARLNQAVIYFDGWDACVQEQATPPHLLAELVDHPDVVVVGGRAAWRPKSMGRRRTVLPVEFGLPDYAHRQELWNYYLDTVEPVHESVDAVELAARFTLTTGQVRDAVASAYNRALRRGEPMDMDDLFLGARFHSEVQLVDMARKITARFGWEDIILPPDQVQILRELVATVRGRSKVLEEWGLGQKLVSSAGITVLFAGPPGTGKTMAAEVIAKDLGLDVYKIDLSNLVSKYIGETEKNLEKVFSEAQSSNAILFFDEADAIFGKRAGVKDARDRYANIEVSYLLQRMEMYDGVTILATNLRSNIDEAFLRRLQFAVDIPFPDEKDRLRIWKTLFPATVPHSEDVNLEDLARRFKLAGGNIRNILVSAAYLAANDGNMITMAHLLHGTRRELQKMGRLVPDSQS